MNLKDEGAAGTALTTTNGSDGKKDDATSGNRATLDRGPERTRPPTSGVDPHRRFSEALSEQDLELCPDCGSGDVDLWITEGATSCRGRCVDCGRELDHREAREAWERAQEGSA
jgi:DNA-directed RNA polymerase subunit RPC12/RpoP